MRREQLIECIVNDQHVWSCPENEKCGKPEADPVTCCILCADRMLSKYEKKIAKKAEKKAQRKAVNHFVEWLGTQMADVKMDAMDRAELYAAIIEKQRTMTGQEVPK